jgi:hypothetical protein
VVIVLCIKSAPFIKSFTAFARITGFADTDYIVSNVIAAADFRQDMVGGELVKASAIDADIALLTLFDPFSNRA